MSLQLQVRAHIARPFPKEYNLPPGGEYGFQKNGPRHGAKGRRAAKGAVSFSPAAYRRTLTVTLTPCNSLGATDHRAALAAIRSLAPASVWAAPLTLRLPSAGAGLGCGLFMLLMSASK